MRHDSLMLHEMKFSKQSLSLRCTKKLLFQKCPHPRSIKENSLRTPKAICSPHSLLTPLLSLPFYSLSSNLNVGGSSLDLSPTRTFLADTTMSATHPTVSSIRAGSNAIRRHPLKCLVKINPTALKVYIFFSLVSSR